MDKFVLNHRIATSPATVYETWMTSAGHAKMIGEQAEIRPEEGAEFSMWDGYITGKNLELQPNVKIVQAWRTTEFPDDAPDSRLEIILLEDGQGTALSMEHTHIPTGQGPNYKQGWKDHYFDALDAMFKAGKK